MPALLAIDWGTSSLRGVLLDANGDVASQERTFARGILTVPAGGFPEVFRSCFGDWMRPDLLCLICGMAGSQQGWREAPYCPCPAGFEDVANHLLWLQEPEAAALGRIAIVPGLQCDNDGVPDVMRGEETQIFGALDLLGKTDTRVVLPGTHSKWTRVEHKRVMGFTTWMTGEFYAMLRQHSILARSLPAEEPPHDAEAFALGVATAMRGQGLLHTAFSVRTLSLFKRLSSDALPSYLSGIVIGEELHSQTLVAGESVVLIGAPALTARYEAALGQQGVSAERVASHATWHGLHAIAIAMASTLQHGKP